MTAGWCIIEVLDSHFGGARFEEREQLRHFSDYSMGCRPEESQIDSRWRKESRPTQATTSLLNVLLTEHYDINFSSVTNLMHKISLFT